MRGGWNSTGRAEADGLKKISVGFLNKHGYFERGYRSGVITWTSGWDESKSNISISSTINDDTQKVHITYTITKHDGEKKDIDYDVPLTATPCNYGSERYWFTCPLYRNGRYCGRRVGTLYLGNGDYFGCRHCYDLTYASRNASEMYKGFVSAPDIDAQREKVKRMYYRGEPTRNYRKYLKMEEQFEMGLFKAVAKLDKRFGGIAKKYGV